VPMLSAVLESTTGIKLRELIAGQGQPAGFAVLPTAAVRIDPLVASDGTQDNALGTEDGAFHDSTSAAAPLNGYIERADTAPSAA